MNIPFYSTEKDVRKVLEKEKRIKSSIFINKGWKSMGDQRGTLMRIVENGIYVNNNSKPVFVKFDDIKTIHGNNNDLLWDEVYLTLIDEFKKDEEEIKDVYKDIFNNAVNKKIEKTLVQC
jgi:hypothetical protein